MYTDLVLFPLKHKSWHNANFVVIGGTTGHHNDNL